MAGHEYQQEIDRIKAAGLDAVGARTRVHFLKRLPFMLLHDIGARLVSVASGSEGDLWYVDWLLTELRRRDRVGSGIGQRQGV